MGKKIINQWNVIKGILPMALLCAMMVCILFLVLIHKNAFPAQEKEVPYYQLDPVVITGSYIPDHRSRVARSVSIISREEIGLLPVDNVQDLLEYVNGVDIRQRGTHGVQADVSIRGSTFEQTLILVDGINVNDPQTGHHNLDLPINLEDIERIEVLKGPGARIYGGMSGAINIITRDVERSAVEGQVKYGQHDFYGLDLNGAFKTGDTSNRASFSRRSSSGHLKDKPTDFDIRTLAYKSTINKGAHKYQINLGFVDKDFGAYGFYSDAYPNEREQTDTLFAHSSANLEFEDLEVIPRVFWRRHNDDFRIEIPELNHWNRNEHRTDTFGTQLNSRFTSEWGITAFGGEITFESLDSSNMGDHKRDRSGIFLEHKYYPVEWLTFGLGVSAMKYSGRDWEFWPGTELNVELIHKIHWFSSFGRSFRIPTYTELYYNLLADPNTVPNLGNPNLNPEKAWTYETGIRWREKGLSINFSLFWRDSKDLIDWSRIPGETTWKVRNISESTTQGFESGLDFHPSASAGKPNVSSVHLAYTYLDSDWDPGPFESKYVLDHLRHQLHGSITLDWYKGLTQTVKARYEERMIGDSYTIIDTRLGYRLNQYEFFLEASNLLDEEYVESGFAPMPDFWIIGGIRFNMNF
ncbi:MAG: TonB-dependent receptor plug domain-containing protein [bacterium]